MTVLADDRDRTRAPPLPARRRALRGADRRLAARGDRAPAARVPAPRADERGAGHDGRRDPVAAPPRDHLGRDRGGLRAGRSRRGGPRGGGGVVAGPVAGAGALPGVREHAAQGGGGPALPPLARLRGAAQHADRRADRLLPGGDQHRGRPLAGGRGAARPRARLQRAEVEGLRHDPDPQRLPLYPERAQGDRDRGGGGRHRGRVRGLAAGSRLRDHHHPGQHEHPGGLRGAGVDLGGRASRCTAWWCSPRGASRRGRKPWTKRRTRHATPLALDRTPRDRGDGGARLGRPVGAAGSAEGDLRAQLVPGRRPRRLLGGAREGLLPPAGPRRRHAELQGLGRLHRQGGHRSGRRRAGRQRGGHRRRRRAAPR